MRGPVPETETKKSAVLGQIKTGETLRVKVKKFERRKAGIKVHKQELRVNM